jgi:hypothetical protein
MKKYSQDELEKPEQYQIDEDLYRFTKRLSSILYNEIGEKKIGGRKKLKEEFLSGKHADIVYDHLQKHLKEQEKEQDAQKNRESFFNQVTPPKGYKIQVDHDRILNQKFILISGIFEQNFHDRIKRIGGKWRSSPGLWAVPFEKVKSLDRVFKNYSKKQGKFENEKIISEIKRWYGYIEKNAICKGFFYNKGFEKLKELEFEKHTPELVENIKEIREKVKVKEISRWQGYVEDTLEKDHYIYTRGIDELKNKMNKKEFNRYHQEIVNKYKEIRGFENKKPKSKSRILLSLSQPVPFDVPMENIRNRDQVIVYTNHGKPFMIDEDAPSVAGSHLLGCEGELGAYFYYREADEKEKEEFFNDKREKQKIISQKKSIEDVLYDFRLYARKNGIKPNETVAFPEGEKVFDTFNPYGGGEAIIISKDAVWYIKNNGSDGDLFEVNNVITGGAGAIGYKLDKNDKNIQDAIKILKEYLQKDEERDESSFGGLEM